MAQNAWARGEPDGHDDYDETDSDETDSEED